MDRSSSAKTITRALAAEGTALAAGGAAHLLHAGTQRNSVTAFIGRSVSRCALQTD